MIVVVFMYLHRKLIIFYLQSDVEATWKTVSLRERHALKNTALYNIL